MNTEDPLRAEHPPARTPAQRRPSRRQRRHRGRVQVARHDAREALRPALAPRGPSLRAHPARARHERASTPDLLAHDYTASLKVAA